ncbi:MAG: porin family protein [Bacteroidales bacterium]|nr:porin family protein [Bacteroidales bacterium]
MKKVLLLAALAFITITSQAQFIIGGTIGASLINDNSEYDGQMRADNMKERVFSFDLRGGYQINDRLQVGLMVGYKYGDTLNHYSGADIYTEATNEEEKYNTFKLAAYGRYTCIKFNKFGVFAELQAGMNKSNGTVHIAYLDDASLDQDIDKGKTTELFAKIIPGLSYQLTDNVSIDLNLGFLGFGYSHKQVKKMVSEKEDIHNTSSFGMDLRTGGLSIMDFMQDVTFGVNIAL